MPLDFDGGFDPLVPHGDTGSGKAPEDLGVAWDEPETGGAAKGGAGGVGAPAAAPESQHGGSRAYPPAPKTAEAPSVSPAARESKSIIKKICVIGNPGVGKKTIVGKVAPFNKEILRYTETIGTAITKYLLNYDRPAADFKLLLIIWDVTGKTAFQHLQRAYYRGAEGLVVVADGSDEDSLEAIPRWIDSAWDIVGKVPTVVIINKMDQVPRNTMKDVDKQVKAALGERAGSIPLFYIDRDFDFDELRLPFFKVAEMLQKHIEERMKKAKLRRRTV